MFPLELKKNKLIKFDIDVLQKLENSCLLVGIDEVGRGALAGPVISCAFSWKQNTNWVEFKKQYPLLKKINDSKQVKSNHRQELYGLLFALGEVGIGYASVLEIEKLNILNATFLAMKRAYENLLGSKKHAKPYILIDGNKFNPYLNCRQLPIIGGDAKSSVIASASIIAKVYRDNLMQRISQAESFKYYSWERNVGYGTRKHCLAIKEKGVSSLHRRLFTRKVLSLTQ